MTDLETIPLNPLMRVGLLLLRWPSLSAAFFDVTDLDADDLDLSIASFCEYYQLDVLEFLMVLSWELEEDHVSSTRAVV